MQNLNNLLMDVLELGEFNDKERTGVGTISVFGTMLKWDLREGFPAVTNKFLAWNAVISELLWFLSGSANVYDLAMLTHENKVKKTIWTGNYESQARNLGYTGGYLGPVYGKQWRDFRGVDQIKELLHNLVSNPQSRRHLVTAWNPEEVPKMALPPCHYGFQVNVCPNYEFIDLLWTQRSVDCFLGLPFNIASYGALLCIIAQITGYEPRYLTFQGGDTHIYLNHREQVCEMLNNEIHTPPTLQMPEFNSLDTLLKCNPRDFKLINYSHSGVIKAPMAI